MGSFLKRIRETWKHLPQLVRFSFAAHRDRDLGGWFVLALLLWTDVNGVGSLIWASDSPALAVGMLAANGILCWMPSAVRVGNRQHARSEHIATRAGRRQGYAHRPLGGRGAGGLPRRAVAKTFAAQDVFRKSQRERPSSVGR